MRKQTILVLLIVVGIRCFPDEGILIVTEEWPPYNYLQDGEVIGVSAEIVRSIMLKIDRQYPIKLYPSMRAKMLIDTRPRTILFSLFRTPEREANYRWLGPIIEESIYFYKLKDAPLIIRSLDDTKKVASIACRRAGIIHDLLVLKGYANLDVSGTDSKQVYGKLLAKRCDLAISDTDIGVAYYFRSTGKSPSLFEKNNFPFFTSQLYIAFSKDISDEEFLTWKSAFAELRRIGEINRIIKKYLP